MRHRAWLALAVTALLLAACGQISEAPDTETSLDPLALLTPDASYPSGDDSAQYWQTQLGLDGTGALFTVDDTGSDVSNFFVPPVPAGYPDYEWVAVVVRSGSTYYVFDDPAPLEGDELNTGGSWDIAFLYKAPAEPEAGGEWCSPGFWRNNPWAAADAAEAGWFSLSDLYSALIGPIAIENEGQAERLGASDDPTLWEVLQMPQVYGGDAFNAVGDLLSDAHPDVDFVYGERVEDSCSLSADASRGGTTGPSGPRGPSIR